MWGVSQGKGASSFERGAGHEGLRCRHWNGQRRHADGGGETCHRKQRSAYRRNALARIVRLRGMRKARSHQAERYHRCSRECDVRAGEHFDVGRRGVLQRCDRALRQVGRIRRRSHPGHLLARVLLRETAYDMAGCHACLSSWPRTRCGGCHPIECENVLHHGWQNQGRRHLPQLGRARSRRCSGGGRRALVVRRRAHHRRHGCRAG